MTTELDDRDRQILALLQADARLGYAAISRHIHLSASAVQRRVERMTATGVLVGARVRAPIEAPAAALTIFLLAELVDDTAATLRRFADSIAASTAVIEAIT